VREKTNINKIKEFMRSFRSIKTPVKAFFTGGASAVLLGFRDTTIDVDVKFVPDIDEIFRLIPSLKEKLKMNIELAAPSDFIPELPDWERRCIFIEKYGEVSFYHYDFYSQVLAKIERGHAQDIKDVEMFILKGYVEPGQVIKYFKIIKKRLYRYPAIDPVSFEKSVESIVKKIKKRL